MAIPFPHSIGFISEVSLSEFIPNYQTTSLSYIHRSRNRGIHRLDGTFTFTITGENNKKALRAFLLKVRGRGEAIELNLGCSVFDTAIFGTPKCNGAIGIGADSFSVDSFSGEIPAGALFTLPNDTKVYTATNSIFNGGVVDVFPPIRKAHVDNSSLNFSDVTLSVNLTEDTQTVAHTEQGIIHTIAFTFQEALV